MAKRGPVINRRTALAAGAGLIGALAELGSRQGEGYAEGLFGGANSEETVRVAANWQGVQAALGKQGTLEEGGVFHFELGRETPAVHMAGMRILPSFALAAEIAMMPMAGGMVMAAGEIPCLETELNGVITRLFDGGLMVSAIHNHRIEIAPHIMWIHFMGQGDPVVLARALRTALPGEGSIFSSGAPAPQRTPLPHSELSAILGGKAQIQDGGVVEAMVPRRDQIRMNGMVLPPSMGVAFEIYFQPMGGRRAAVTVELPLIGAEVNRVARSLRGSGFQLSALHNHMIGEQPRLFYLHGSAMGDSVALAGLIRAALNLTAAKPGNGGAGKG